VPVGKLLLKTLQGRLGFQEFWERLGRLIQIIQRVSLLNQIVDQDVLIVETLRARRQNQGHQNQSH